jgi:hypothetical protein
MVEGALLFYRGGRSQHWPMNLVYFRVLLVCLNSRTSMVAQESWSLNLEKGAARGAFERRLG